MPQPTGGDLYVSKPLTNISIAYMQGQEDFIADRMFPPVPVEQQGGQYYTYNRGDWFRTRSAKRAPATESVGAGWRTGTDNYFAEVYAVHNDVNDQDRANQEKGIFDLDQDATEFVTRDMLLRRELDWVDAYFKAGVWAMADQTGVAGVPGANQFKQWDQATATPIEDMEAYRLGMKKVTGYNPNRLVLGAEVYSSLKNSAQMLERIKYVQRGVVTLDLIASMLDIEQVLTPEAIYNTANEGAADDDVMDFVYGKAMLLAYAAPRPGKKQPSAGYTFEWNSYMAKRGTKITKFRMENIKSDRVEIESAYSFKVVGSELGQYFASAVG